MATSIKKAVEAAKLIADFCKEQVGCQNCIFRQLGADHTEAEAIEAWNRRASE